MLRGLFVLVRFTQPALLRPGFCDALPQLCERRSERVLRSLDMIILVTPIWKTFVRVLAHTYVHALA